MAYEKTALFQRLALYVAKVPSVCPGCVLQRVQFTLQDTPPRIGRKTVDASSRPFWHRCSARFEPSERLLAPALRLAIRATFEKLGFVSGSDGNVI